MEIWEDIEAYRGYQVSSLGRVRTAEGELLKIYIRDPYNCVYLRKPYSRTVCIHRLVALAFIPNPENKREVNHIDGDTQNNSIENLEWCTHSDNIRHFYHAECFKEKSSLARSKIIAAHKGRSISEETRRKISESQKGKIIPEETRKKISEAKKGKPGTRTGSKLTEEQRKHLSEVHKGIKQSEESNKKRSETLLGHNVSNATRTLISERLKGLIWVTNGIDRKHIHENELSSYLASGYVRGMKIKGGNINVQQVT